MESSSVKNHWSKSRTEFERPLERGRREGYDDNRSLGNGESGGRVAGPIFEDFMAEALKTMPTPPFRIPSGVSLVRINAVTGKLAAEYGRKKRGVSRLIT